MNLLFNYELSNQGITEEKTVQTESKNKPLRVVRDPEFAKRLNMAADASPHVPPLHRGRLTWVQAELKSRFSEFISLETVRKWFAGEMVPRRQKLQYLAQLLAVEVSWLSLGNEPDLPSKERKARNATADASVNLVAALIQMGGGHPAFPDPGDERAKSDGVDLYAIIRGANYALHVVVGSTVGITDGRLAFSIPASHQNVVLIAVVADEHEFCFKVYEIPQELTVDLRARSGSVILTTTADQLRPIKNFNERI